MKWEPSRKSLCKLLFANIEALQSLTVNKANMLAVFTNEWSTFHRRMPYSFWLALFAMAIKGHLKAIKAIKRSDHNALSLYHPACFLLPPPTFFWTIRSTNESRRFSLETDIRVWKNAVGCFINTISKNQAEKNDSRQIVFFKIIFLYLLAFYLFYLIFNFRLFQVRTYVRAYR